MDIPTSGVICTIAVGVFGLVYKFVPARSNSNGNGVKKDDIKNAVDDHRLNCEVKPILGKHEVVIAVLTTELKNISDNVSEIKERNSKLDVIEDAVLEIRNKFSAKEEK